MPAAHRVVRVNRALTDWEFRALQAGVMPRDMDDRWWIVFEASWARFHRSWTGFCVYAARTEVSAGNATIVELHINGDTEQYEASPSDDEERERFEGVLRNIVFAPRSRETDVMELVEDPVETFRQELKRLRKAREDAKAQHRRPRERLTAKQREQVKARTGGHCHVCGGLIPDGEPWHADHVLAHSAGGVHEVENYLPAHASCNKYRWDYRPEEFELILKLGVWLRTQIETGSTVGRAAAEAFLVHEARRERRRAPAGEEQGLSASE